MTKAEFDSFIAELREKGFTHVKTYGGALKLSDWRPYGAFGGLNPGIEHQIGGFQWIGENRAADYAAQDPAGALVTGVWTFVKLAGDEELDPAE